MVCWKAWIVLPFLDVRAQLLMLGLLQEGGEKETAREMNREVVERKGFKVFLLSERRIKGDSGDGYRNRL